MSWLDKFVNVSNQDISVFLEQKLQSLCTSIHNIPSLRNKCVRVSECYSFCFRKWVLMKFFNIKEEEVQFSQALTFSIGSLIHKILQTELLSQIGLIGNWVACDRSVVTGRKPEIHKCGNDCWKYKEMIVEKDLLCGWRLKGHVDGLLLFNNESYVLEIKSINALLFDRIAAPPADHYVQLQLYMSLLNVSKGVFLYVRKSDIDQCPKCNTRVGSTVRFKVFKVELDKEVIRRFTERFQYIEDLYRNQLPRRICTTVEDGIRIKCPVASLCFADSIDKDVVITENLIKQVEQ